MVASIEETEMLVLSGKRTSFSTLGAMQLKVGLDRISVTVLSQELGLRPSISLNNG
jgi:hypothetical protein